VTGHEDDRPWCPPEGSELRSSDAGKPSGDHEPSGRYAGRHAEAAPHAAENAAGAPVADEDDSAIATLAGEVEVLEDEDGVRRRAGSQATYVGCPAALRKGQEVRRPRERRQGELTRKREEQGERQ
jgi:hypothetical protein